MQGNGFTEISEVHSKLDDLETATPLVTTEFFQRMSAGSLSRQAVQAFAEQFRHFEQILPMFLTAIVDKCDHPVVRTVVEDNLRDESGTDSGVSHLELLDRFITAIDARTDAPSSAAMQCLLDTCAYFINRSVAEGVAVLLAYEVQAPAVSQLIADAMRSHYSVPDDAIEFWNLHAELDTDHADWLCRGLAEMDENIDDAFVAVRDINDEWIAFLDEQLAAIS